MKICIVGEDKRYEELAELLAPFATQYSCWRHFLESEEEKDTIDLLFLAIGMVHSEESLVIPSSVKEIWTGSKHQFITNPETSIVHYTTDEEWLWMNADLTAESFLRWYYTTHSRRIQAYKWEIAGYGRIAKTLAPKLVALGADVQIRTRSLSQQAEARQAKLKAVDLYSPLTEGCICVNTIPAAWLSKDQAERASELIDLASMPGGLLEDVDKPYHHLLALPGKVYPVDAAHDFYRVLKWKGIG